MTTNTQYNNNIQNTMPTKKPRPPHTVVVVPSPVVRVNEEDGTGNNGFAVVIAKVDTLNNTKICGIVDNNSRIVGDVTGANAILIGNIIGDNKKHAIINGDGIPEVVDNNNTTHPKDNKEIIPSVHHFHSKPPIDGKTNRNTVEAEVN